MFWFSTHSHQSCELTAYLIRHFWAILSFCLLQEITRKRNEAPCCRLGIVAEILRTVYPGIHLPVATVNRGPTVSGTQ